MSDLPWRRFVALGDSLTEGVGDPRPDGSLRGWADRLAEAFSTTDPSFGYANLARRGLRTAEVRRGQLDRALELRPDLASAVSGMNDLLLPGFRPERYAEELASIVEPLRATGAEVITGTFPDITRFAYVRGPFVRGVRSRLLDANEAVREVARRHDALCLDGEVLPEARHVGVMSVDRLHPGPAGHLLIAQGVARLLTERSGVPLPIPRAGSSAGRLAQARWLARQLDVREVGRFVSRFWSIGGAARQRSRPARAPRGGR